MHHLIGGRENGEDYICVGEKAPTIWLFALSDVRWSWDVGIGVFFGQICTVNHAAG
jgi:hypothetical protein